MANTEKTKQENVAKGSSGRGVSYPAISLEQAVLRAKQFWEHERKNAAPVEAAGAHWGYSPTSSGVRTMIAALLSYGLLADKGSGEKKEVQLTGRALDIILDTPDKGKALIEAVKSPKIYAELLTQWPPPDFPSDQTIKVYLLRNKNFNPKAVDGFIEDFRGSISYSGLLNADNMPKYKTPKVKIGDFVQRVVAGESQYPQPREVTGLSEDGQFAYLDEIESVPVKELKVVEAKPGVPFPAPIIPNPQAGIRQDVFSVDEGQVILRWPEKMSEASFGDFKEWLDLQVKKIARQSGVELRKKKDE